MGLISNNGRHHQIMGYISISPVSVLDCDEFSNWNIDQNINAKISDCPPPPPEPPTTHNELYINNVRWRRSIHHTLFEAGLKRA